MSEVGFKVIQDMEEPSRFVLYFGHEPPDFFQEEGFIFEFGGDQYRVNSWGALAVSVYKLQ